MTRYPTTQLAGEKTAAQNGAHGGATFSRRLFSVLFCAAVLVAGLAVTARAAERYTRDKSPAPAATAVDPSKEDTFSSAATPINGSTATATKTAPPKKGHVFLGATTVKSPADFGECVRVSLAQSPILTKSAIEIESKRLDVGDAYSQYIPTIVMNTTFYMRLPELKNTDGQSAMQAYAAGNNKSPQAYSSLVQYIHASDPNKDRASYDLSFSTGTWNPLVTAFDVMAKKELVNIAVLAHLRVIDEGLKQLGSTFLQLGMVESMVKLSKEKEELAKKNLEYVNTKVGLGQSAELEVRIAQGKINMAKAETEKLQTNRAVLLDGLKFIMGVPAIQKVDLDLANYQKQVLDNFNPADVTEERLQKHSFPLRIKQYEHSLQKKNIALSYIHFLPTFSMGFTSISTLNNSSYKSDSSKIPFMYPNLNFSLPLDWWTKIRDVNRQYKKLSQLSVETHNLEFQISSEFQKAQAKLRACVSDLKLAQANADVQKLQVQQAQLRFDSGQAEYDMIVKSMESYLDSQQNVLLKEQERNAAMLDLRFMSGDFQDHYINATVMESL